MSKTARVKQFGIVIASLALGGASVFAQSPATQPAPLLEQINRETQSLFESVKPGLVRVQLPVPRWMAQLGEMDDPLAKWNLDPKVKERLRAERAKMLSGQVESYITPSTLPSAPTTQESAEQRRWQMTIFQRPDGGFEFATPAGALTDSVIGAIVAPRAVGIVYDDAGHVVIPIYIDPDALDETHSLVVSGYGGGASRAKLVGSDRQTNLSVLQLEHQVGRAAPFAGARPADGSLIMMLSTGGESGKLSVWSRGQQERGLVVTVEGKVTGFARMGQFLDAQIARPVIDQLIQYGQVRRATLGVVLTEAESPDGRRAMHVDRIKPGSAADVAGMREGDFILSLAGAAVDDLPNFAAAISTRDGHTAIQILRGSEVIELQVELRPNKK